MIAWRYLYPSVPGAYIPERHAYKRSTAYSKRTLCGLGFAGDPIPDSRPPDAKPCERCIVLAMAARVRGEQIAERLA